MARRKSQQRKPFLSRVGEAFDRVVFAVSPDRGVNRFVKRRIGENYLNRREPRDEQNTGGGFKGADNDRLYGHRWLTRRLSAASREELDQEDLRVRSREIYMNHSAGGAIDSRVNNTVGCGFKPQSKIEPLERDGKVLFTKEEADRVNKQLEKLYRDIEPRLAVDRRRSLWQQSRLMDRHFNFDGEALAVLTDIGDADQEIPLAVEVIDPDRLQTPPERDGDPRVRMGVERDARGKITHYWIRKTHPDDNKEQDLEFDRVPAERVCHVYEPWFAGQSRGLPIFTRVLDDLRNAGDMEEATIIAAQMEACDAVFVKTKIGASRAATGDGSGTNSRGQRINSYEPGGVVYLNDGEEIDHHSPQKTGGTFAPFMQWCYRRIAAGCNIIYEFFAKDWKGLSFAGGRLALTEARLDSQARQKYLIELFLRFVWERMVTEAVIMGLVDIDVRLFNAYRRHFLSHAWIAPAFPYAINPVQEVDADVKAIDNNLDTRANRLAARGLDIEEVDGQREKERQSEREKNIEPPAKAGAPAPADDRPDDRPTDETDTSEEEAGELVAA